MIRIKAILYLAGLFALAGIIAGCGGASDPSLFRDDFESYSSFPTGPWSLGQGVYSDTDWIIAGDNGSKVAHHNYSSSNRWNVMVAGDESWSDYSCTLKVKPEDSIYSNRFGLVARYHGDGDSAAWYTLFIEKSAGATCIVKIAKTSGGTVSSLASVETDVAYTGGTWYTLRLDLNGTNLKAYLNGTLRVEYDDDGLTHGAVPTQGKIGFESWRTDSFDDVEVMPLPAA